MSPSSCWQQIPRDDSDLFGYYQLYKCLNFTNFTRQQEAFQEFVEASQRSELPPMLGLTAAFVLLIVAGSAANLLLISVVCSRRTLRSSHNLFVLNLACSDLLLCLVTQPLNVLRLLQPYYSWQYGSALCRLGSMLPGVNLFVSTLSVSAIALDRFHTIVHRSTGRVPRRRLQAFVLLIWCLGFLLAAPLGWLAQVMDNRLMVTRRTYLCSEHTSHPAGTAGKLAYSCVTLAVQFLIPLLVLLVAYARISRVMQQRAARSLPPGGQQKFSEYRRRRSRRERRRQTRAKSLLVLTVGLFILSWCPLTILNIYLDVKTWMVQADASGESDNAFRIQLVQGTCLLLVLASACANPALHGFFNETLRAEFRRVICRRKSTSRHQTEAAGQLVSKHVPMLVPQKSDYQLVEMPATLAPEPEEPEQQDLAEQTTHEAE